MRIDALTVALRPRSSWEAVELGTALVRRHAAAVWRPWLVLTLPVFALVNAAAWAIGHVWLAALVMWWLKPLFDRLPLFVLSRAVFGEVPDVRTTLRGAFRGAFPALWGQLLWRRLTPARSLLLPVDMLEGGPSAHAASRRSALAGPVYGVAALTLLAFAHFEVALVLGLATFAFLFVPTEYMQSSLVLLWQQVLDAPAWLALLQNGLLWAATSALEPFYVGAGFGQYLNRRTEIEGWDIELAFRRMAARLRAGSGAILLAVAFALPLAVRAQQAAPSCPLPLGTQAAKGQSLRTIFGPEHRDPARFIETVERTWRDPRISPRRKVTVWEARTPEKQRTGEAPGWLRSLLGGIATAGELMLWGLLGALVLLLVLTARRWWPWLQSFAAEPPAPLAPVDEREAHAPPPLPDDIVAAARAHFAAGQPREALALVYRAAVAAMLASTGRTLPPGATEAQCLRAASALPADVRDAFARVVRQWQHAAYADRMPDADAFDAVLTTAASRFGWRT